MYSFAQRKDTRVFDEPLYAHFLKETNAERPDRKETLAQLENSGHTVIEKIILGEHDTDVLFFKNIANHVVDLDLNFLNEVYNVILIRDPREMLLSYTKVIKKPSMLDLAVGFQEKLYKKTVELERPAIVLDSKQLLLDPSQVLRKLCKATDIPWQEAMLSWEAGARKEDGPWAKYWYQGVHQSTGFKAYNEREGALAGHLIPLYEKCLPIYEYLSPLSIQAV